MALQATNQGLVIHIIEGFNKENLRKKYTIPTIYHIEVLITVGKPTLPENFSAHLQKQKQASARHPISAFVFKDKFH